MHIVIIHFHLKTGGVTSVIKQQAACLVGAGHQVLLLTGEAPCQKMPAPVAVVPGLAYDNEWINTLSATQIGDAIIKAIDEQLCHKNPDLIHIHNPTLAKNHHIQSVLKQLQHKGFTLLCQIHDFAEDGRPDVYFEAPYLQNCHYATVNQRDRTLLCHAGLNAEGVHHLPNAILPINGVATHAGDTAGAVVYPVRAIRRKNIGEAILLHQYCPVTAPLLITQPPNSDRDKPGYLGWQKLCKQHRLPVVFEAGVTHNFDQLMADCRYVITTSVTEGFGFTFLEPWTAGKALWGRLLPDICQDFADKGVDLDHLYRNLRVPLDLLDARQLETMWHGYLRQALLRYGHRLSDDNIAVGWQTITHNGLIDFSLLEESFQQVIVTKVIKDQQVRQQLIMLNPFLSQSGPPADSRRLIDKNQAAVRRHFSLEAYGQRLMKIYQKVLNTPIEQSINKKVLLNFFMAAERFSLLKWGKYHGSSAV